MRKSVRSGRRAAAEALEGRTLLAATSLPNAIAQPTYIVQRAFGNVAPTTGLLANGLTPATSPPAAAEITPTEMLQAYGVNNIKFGTVVGNGAGQTIAIIDAYDDPNAFSDLTTFDAAYGVPVLPASQFTKLNETGGTTLPAAGNGWQLEESLDIEWAHVIAPDASIILYEANSASFSDLVENAVNTARKNASVSVVSMSFSTGEFSGETGWDTYFTTPTSPAHQGVTFLAATGDSGSPGGYPAYSPDVIAVGGTTLLLNSNGTYYGETAWSDSGGGTSTQESTPSYQLGTQTTGKRTIPDISMDADPSSGVPVYDSYNGGWFQVGGTSLATPMAAALIAIADQGRVMNGLSTLDGHTQTLPTLYASPAGDFNDVTSGSNGGFTAGPGYDEVTGIGTPVANLLIPTLAEDSSSVALKSSANPSAPGQSVTFTATVTSTSSGTPGGTVNFKDGATLIGTGTLNGSGVATLTISSLATGAHSVTATYGGNSTFAPNLSSALTQSVSILSSSTVLATTQNPSKSGQSITFTATVSGSGVTPTGTVTFKDGSTTLGTGTLNSSGVTTYTTTELSVASHSITASYSGDSAYNGSTSSTLTQVVQQAATSTILGSVPNPSVFGQVITLTATVAIAGAGGGTPSGTVTFKDGSTTLGTGTLNASGVATYTSSSLAIGPHSFTASYGGSTNFTTSASSTVSQVVNQASSATALISSTNPAVIGQSVTLTATVTASSPSTGIPTGSVTFKDGSTTLGAGTLNGSGVATLSTSTLPSGSNSITATYGGSTNYASSTSSPLSQLITAATATYVGTDTSTEGTWTGVYGSDGYSIFGGNSSLPSYAQLSTTGASEWTWGTSSSDLRGLQTASGSTSRIEATDYSFTSFSFNLNLTDGQSHQVALYLLDYDPLGRTESVQITNTSTGTVLDTRNVSNFSSGQWLVWDLSGAVTITITNTGSGPQNAVASGIFFDPAGTTTIKSTSATYVGTDTTTEGTWTGVYGSNGYSIFGGNSSLPAYAQLSTSGASQWTWATSAGDPRGLQTSSGSSSRIEACDYSPTSFSFNLNLTDGQSHQVALYLLDYDPLGRTETVQITSTGIGTVLDTRNVSNFSGGQWLVWNLSGAVTITITNTGTSPQNAVASGIFFDPAGTTTITSAAASYVTTDTTTEGTWTGVYGSDGYSIFGGNSSLPSNVQLSTSGASEWTWGTSASDPRGLQTSSGSSSRLDACDYSATSFSMTLNLADGLSHQVALYLLDYDNLARNETIQISNAITGAVLDTQTVSNFANGQWLVWNVTGDVTITIINNGAQNAVVSGIFIG